MAADLTKYTSAAWRAVYVWRGRYILPIIDAQIEELERILIQLVSVALPILDPKAGSPRDDGDYRVLRDPWGFPRKRFRGRGPILIRDGLPIDVALGELREVLGKPDAELEEVLSSLGHLLDDYERLRGRGCKYGLLSRGVSAQVAQTVAGTQLGLDLAQGNADVCANSLLRAAEKALAVAMHDASADFARIVYREWVDTGVADVQFRILLLESGLLECDMEALDILMGYPGDGIGWFQPFGIPEMPTWRILCAMALGVTYNDSFEPTEVPEGILHEVVVRAA